METGTASPTASADSEVGAPWVLLGIWGCREAEGQLLGRLCGADIPIWRDLPSSPQLVWQICQQVRAEWLSPDLAGLPGISLPADGLIRRPPRDASVPPRLQLYTCVCAHTRTHTHLPSTALTSVLHWSWVERPEFACCRSASGSGQAISGPPSPHQQDGGAEPSCGGREHYNQRLPHFSE